MRVVLCWLTWVGIGALALAADPAGSRRVGEWKWAGLSAKELPGKVVDDVRHGKVLHIERTETSPQTVRLATWKSPGIKTAFYAVRGQIRYDGVEGTGYMEMWNEFGDSGRFFSRTMGEQGPMRTVTGTSPWRTFYLPFNSTGAPGFPTALEINLVLAGKGQVEIGDMELLEFADAGAMWAGMGVAALDGRPRTSRWLVTAAAGVAAGVGVAGVSLACRWFKQRQARELRRMRARDAG